MSVNSSLTVHCWARDMTVSECLKENIRQGYKDATIEEVEALYGAQQADFVSWCEEQKYG